MHFHGMIEIEMTNCKSVNALNYCDYFLRLNSFCFSML